MNLDYFPWPLITDFFSGSSAVTLQAEVALQCIQANCHVNSRQRLLQGPLTPPVINKFFNSTESPWI